MTGELYDVDRVMEKVMSDKLFYEKSGGGMTLSGGEPLLQHEFSAALLSAAKEKGLHTCMETCGQEKHCGNRYCSAHPKHIEKKKPNPKGKRYKPPNNK